jgi:hypothetical protein
MGAVMTKMTLIGRPGCHLCDDARELVERVASDTGTPWSQVSIDGDADLTARYGEQIPVVLVNDKVIGFWRIDERRLRKAVAGRRLW